VQRILREQGVRFVQEVWEEGAEPTPPPSDEAETDVDAGANSGETEETDVEPRAAALRDERREPRFAAPARSGAPMPAPGPRPGVLSAAHREVLQAALAELAECRRLLDAAREDAGS
jgi:hypothetical protein